MTAVSKSRPSLSDLADDTVLDAPLPAFAQQQLTPRSLRLPQIAPNPFNTRDIEADSAKIAEIAESMRLHGQLQAVAVVTREAFLAIFPECHDHKEMTDRVTHVQVMGGRRRAAADLLGLRTLDVVVKDQLAATRAAFLEATAEENLNRQDLDPIEEARAVALIVAEHGSGKLAAERLNKTAPWVSQRLNLLKLEPEIQAAVRAGEVPLRSVREWHRLPAEAQLASLVAWRDGAHEPAAPVSGRPARAAGEGAPVQDPWPAAPPPGPDVKVRLWGTEESCAQAAAALQATGLALDKLSPWRADRGSLTLGRVYAELSWPRPGDGQEPEPGAG